MYWQGESYPQYIGMFVEYVSLVVEPNSLSQLKIPMMAVAF
jgi:hypothetical protein